MRHPRLCTLATLTLLCAVLIAGCGGAERTSNASVDRAALREGQADASARPGTGATAESTSSDRAPVDLISAPLTDAKQIRTGTVQLSARRSRVAGVAHQVVGIVESIGGSVSSERSSGGEEPSVDLVLGVPPERFREALTKIGKVATVISSESSTEDVTGRYADLEGRVATMRISVARLHGFLGEATDVNQIASLETELTRRESELESTQRQLDALAAQVATSTLHVTVSTKAVVVAPTDGPPSPASALARGWAVFVGAGRWLLAAVAVSLPFLALAAGLFVAARLLRRRLRRLSPAS
ncbi:MAG: DUF4349 domain-containing protein [Microthrixaceae bacterium]|nr:DUF4349 domain-containing protein [Microthrixaceae bacterium]